MALVPFPEFFKGFSPIEHALPNRLEWQKTALLQPMAPYDLWISRRKVEFQPWTDNLILQV